MVLLTAFHAEIPAAKTLPRFVLKSHFNAFFASDDDLLRAFAAISNDPHVSDGIFRQTERYICLLYKPANNKFESLLIEFRWALFSNIRQRRKAIATNNGYIGTSYKKGILPCPGFKNVNHAWSQNSSGNSSLLD